MFALRDPDSRSYVLRQLVALQHQNLRKRIRQRASRRKTGNAGAYHYCSFANDLGQSEFPYTAENDYTSRTPIVKLN